MYIKSIHFKNFGRHTDTKIDLACGLVGIVGPNGSGKSTITNGIYAALTNDFGRFDGKKEENITDTAGEKENSSIELVVVHNKQELRILRSLRPNRSKLWLPGQKDPLTKSGDIQREIEERLGINFKMLDRFCFVDQWAMFSFLSDTPGERAKVYQQLCGTEHAQAVCDAITTFLSEDPTARAEIVDNSDELKQELAISRQAETEAKKNRDGWLAKLLPADKLPKAQAALDRRRRWTELKEKEAPTEKKVDDLQGQCASYATLVESDRVVCVRTKERFEKLDAQAQEAYKQLAEAEEAARQRDALKVSESKLTEAKDELEAAIKRAYDLGRHKPHPQVGELDDIDDRRRKIQEELTKKRHRLDALNRGDIVQMDIDLRYVRDKGYTLNASDPLNHTDAVDKFGEIMDDMPKQLGDADVIKTLTAEVSRLEEDKAAADTLRNNIVVHQEHVQAWQNQETRLKERVEVAGKHLADLKVAVALLPDPVDEDKIRDGLKERSSAKADMDKAQKDWEYSSTNLTVARNDLKHALQQLKDIREELEKNLVSDDLFLRASRAVEAHQKAEPQVELYNQRLSDHTHRSVQLDEQLEGLKERLARTQRARQFADRLKTIRDDVLHRQALPQMVAQTNLEDMESDVNEVLDLFGSPFWVETSDDLSFHAHFPGEPPKSAGRLSGGQKGVLAVAFRIAISSLFKSEIGMMSLDEPTAGMDDRNVGYLAEALTRFAAQVRGHRQIIMITHAEELRAAFDQTVDLGDNESGWRTNDSQELIDIAAGG